MARPIAETPVLTGEDAIRFEKLRMEVESLTKEQRAEKQPMHEYGQRQRYDIGLLVESVWSADVRVDGCRVLLHRSRLLAVELDEQGDFLDLLTLEFVHDL